MSRERIRRALDIFRDACDQPAGERGAFVIESCGSDEALRREVEAMLAWDAGGDEEEDQVPAAMRVALLDMVNHAAAMPDPGVDLPHGISGYRILRRVASGGMGDVYEAEQENPRRRVAVKVARGSEASTELTRRFELEVSLLARLRHPRIAQIIEAGTAAGAMGPEPFFVMEFVEGQTLRHYAEDHLLSVRAKIDLVSTICDAVASAHEQGVVHRDLKPDNLLVESDGQPKVLDFGIAKVEAAGGFGGGTMRTEVGRVLGTLGYMAPEQLAGVVDVGPAADVYALGVVLFELLSQRLPHDLSGVTLTQALAVVSTTDAPLLGVLMPQFRGDLEAIVAKALEKDARHRYANARELQHDLERFQRGETVVARVAGPLRRLAKWSLRNRALATAVVGLFSVLAVSSVLLLSANRTARTALDDFARLKDARRLDQAIARAHVVWGSAGEADGPPVWPTRPEQVDGLRQWLDEFSPLFERLADHREALQRIEASAGTRQGDRVTFADPAAQWQYDELADLVADLEQFGAGADTKRQASVATGRDDGRARELFGLLQRVRRRLDLAQTIEKRTVDDRRDDWDAAKARVANDARFAGFLLEPQVGLVPLGPDLDSGLEEFLLLETHADYDKVGVPLVVGDLYGARVALGYSDSPLPKRVGIVLVLVPGLLDGEEFWMGRQGSNPEAPNYDPKCIPELDPYFKVPDKLHPELPAFFLSKYEMTNAQWGRCTGEFPGDGWNLPRRPVRAVGWRQCDLLMQRLGLVLPNEVQWEYAVRAGTDLPWWTGKNEQSLAGHENVLERAGATIYPLGPLKTGEIVADFTDELKLVPLGNNQGRLEGSIGTMPVGSYRPNRFGLHDMAGNLTEWCAAGPAEVGIPVRIVRGGNFMRGSLAARSAWRKETNIDQFALYELGLRPAMQVQQTQDH